MDYKLPLLAGVLAIGVVGVTRGVFGVDPPTPTDLISDDSNDVGDPSATALVDQAIQRLSEGPSISAKVRHRTRLFGQKLVGSGSYLQQSGERGTLSRFSLSIRTDEQMVSMLHVCDGRYLWIRDSSVEDRQVSRVDLRRVKEWAAARGINPATHAMSLGSGLSRLLASLKTNFDFSEPHAVTFQDVPVWAVACHWKADRLAKLLPGSDDLFPNHGQVRLEQLPAQLPDRVFLLIGRDDLFPYHIDFRRSSSKGGGRSDKSHHAESQSLVTIELFEVQFGAELSPTAFIYRTGDINIDDRTDEYLVRIKAGL